MSLKHVDMTSALRRLAERRIEQAMKEGKFDNLPGAGQPLPLDDMPAQEDTRLTWWCVRILKQNDYIPDEIRWRKTVDALRADLTTAQSENRVRALVAQINLLIYKINTLGTNAMKSPMAPLDLAGELDGFRLRRSP
jgi:hypothetical protein